MLFVGLVGVVAVCIFFALFPSKLARVMQDEQPEQLQEATTQYEQLSAPMVSDANLDKLLFWHKLTFNLLACIVRWLYLIAMLIICSVYLIISIGRTSNPESDATKNTFALVGFSLGIASTLCLAAFEIYDFVNNLNLISCKLSQDPTSFFNTFVSSIGTMLILMFVCISFGFVVAAFACIEKPLWSYLLFIFMAMSLFCVRYSRQNERGSDELMSMMGIFSIGGAMVSMQCEQGWCIAGFLCAMDHGWCE